MVKELMKKNNKLKNQRALKKNLDGIVNGY